jgi:ribonuclease BN (tRNA processing enzyme)
VEGLARRAGKSARLPGEHSVSGAVMCSATGFERLPSAWRSYHSTMHTSTRDLAQIACRTRPGLLILYHPLFWSQTEQELLWEIRSGHDGEVVLGKDLHVY